MQIWNAQEVSAAVSENESVEKPVRILQSLLSDTRQQLSNTLQHGFLGLLCCLDEFTLSNPPGVRTVWIAGGSVIDNKNGKKIPLYAPGYSIAESIHALVAEVAKIHSIAASDQSALCHCGAMADYSCLLEYSRSLALTDAGLSVGDATVPLKHLANKSLTRFPQVFCRLLPSSERSISSLSDTSILWDGCAAKPRQRDAIALGICAKIARHCLAKWLLNESRPRVNTAEDEYLFDYYTRRCSRMPNNKAELLLNLSLDWGPPVYAALSRHPDDHTIAIGVGCGSGSHQAISAAVLDMHYSEFAVLQPMDNRYSAGKTGLLLTDLAVTIQAGGTNLLDSDFVRPIGEARQDQFYSDDTFARKVAKQADQNGFDIFYANINSVNNPLAVVKVVSPQLLVPVF